MEGAPSSLTRSFWMVARSHFATPNLVELSLSELQSRFLAAGKDGLAYTAPFRALNPKSLWRHDL